METFDQAMQKITGSVSELEVAWRHEDCRGWP